MYFLIYTSYAAPDFQDDDLKTLLTQSCKKNKALSITGMLLYFDGKFLQLIEGEEQAVKNLYRSICNDKRHKNVVTLKEQTIKDRFFTDWSMGFKSVSQGELAEIKDYKCLSASNGLNKTSALKLFKILSGNK